MTMVSFVMKAGKVYKQQFSRGGPASLRAVLVISAAFTTSATILSHLEATAPLRLRLCLLSHQTVNPKHQPRHTNCSN